MSGKGMQEAGRKGWEGERAVRRNGTAAFINLWISGREERTERWTQRGRIPQDGRTKVEGRLLYQPRGTNIPSIGVRKWTFKVPERQNGSKTSEQCETR